MKRKARRRAGMPNRIRHAKVAPPAAYQGMPGLVGWCSAALAGAVVVTVIVAEALYAFGQVHSCCRFWKVIH